MGQDRRNGNLQDDMRQQEPKPPSSTRTKSSTTSSKKSYKKNDFHFEDLFNTMSLGVIYYDHKGRIINVNPAAELMLGLPRDKIENLSPREIKPRLVDTDGKNLTVSKIPSMIALRTGKIVRDTIIGYHNPAVDQIRWLNTNAMPIFRNGEEKPYMVYTTFSDITEQIEVEQKLMQQQEELEIFASLLRHDLGNDLHAIINQIEWAGLTQQVDTKDFAESMETIKAITFRMAGCLRSLGRPLEELDNKLGSMLNRIAATSTNAHPGIVVRVTVAQNLHKPRH